MGLLILVAGIFAGIAIALASLYSIAQIFLTRGRTQAAHIAVLALTLTVMALLHYRMVAEARLAALPLLLAAMAAFWVEERWFRLFPVLQQLFAAVLIAGWVAL